MLTQKTTRLFLILVLAIAAALSACADQDQTPEPSETTPFVSPLSISPLVSPQPTPEVSAPEIPTPKSGKGTVVGVLYDQVEGKPYANHPIYLARVREMDSQDEDKVYFFAELDTVTAPSAQTDETGRFMIENVAPGKYAIATMLPDARETLLFDAARNVNLAIEIKAGEITDMGLVLILVPD